MYLGLTEASVGAGASDRWSASRVRIREYSKLEDVVEEVGRNSGERERERISWGEAEGLSRVVSTTSVLRASSMCDVVVAV